MSHSEADASTWLTTSQAAARLGISERTVRRRCEGGKLAAHQVTTDSGREWRVDPAAVGADSSGQAADTAPAKLRTGADTQEQPADTCGQAADGVRTPAAKQVAAPADSSGQGAAITADAPATAADTSREQELREEVKFLRGVVEQQQRDAAELRAALREALRMSARALPAGEVDASTSTASAEAPAAPPGAPRVDAAPTVDKPPAGPTAATDRGDVGASTWERSKGLRGWLLRILKG